MIAEELKRHRSGTRWLSKEVCEEIVVFLANVEPCGHWPTSASTPFHPQSKECHSSCTVADFDAVVPAWKTGSRARRDATGGSSGGAQRTNSMGCAPGRDTYSYNVGEMDNGSSHFGGGTRQCT